MQNTNQLLMIKPVCFGYNSQTAVNNSFQKKPIGNIQDIALQEFNTFVDLLRKNKVTVIVVEDTDVPSTPDSVFPNNWISFDENGSIFLYPMFAHNRRMERKTHVIDKIKNDFLVSQTIDLSYFETAEKFLEGTGSMVLDRANKIAYACLSSRTNQSILEKFCQLTGYAPIAFNAFGSDGTAIYHTNVMMCVADKFVVICLESVANELEKDMLRNSFFKTGKEVIEISALQLNNFAGNMLQVKNADDELLLIMSTQAFKSLSENQITALTQYNRIIHSSLQTIEAAGGGSARCMMAEIFLEKKHI